MTQSKSLPSNCGDLKSDPNDNLAEVTACGEIVERHLRLVGGKSTIDHGVDLVSCKKLVHRRKLFAGTSTLNFLETKQMEKRFPALLAGVLGNL